MEFNETLFTSEPDPLVLRENGALRNCQFSNGFITTLRRQREYLRNECMGMFKNGEKDHNKRSYFDMETLGARDAA